tara:strand:+ start:7220 stop:7333 length:114 start_codon:yes stop_codon:yes gene_type:complete
MDERDKPIGCTVCEGGATFTITVPNLIGFDNLGRSKK